MVATHRLAGGLVVLLLASAAAAALRASVTLKHASKPAQDFTIDARDPDAKLPSLVPLDASTKLSVALQGGAFAHAHVLFSPVNPGGSPAVRVPTKGAASAGTMDLDLKKLKLPTGVYAVHVAAANAVGDAHALDLGNVAWSSSSFRSLGPGPEPTIAHVFRDDAKPPNMILATLFTAAVVLPLAVLLPAWLVIVKPLKMRAGSAATYAFVACIFGHVLTAYLHWTGAFGYKLHLVAGPLGTATLLSGLAALREIAAASQN